MNKIVTSRDKYLYVKELSPMAWKRAIEIASLVTLEQDEDPQRLASRIEQAIISLLYDFI